MTSALPILSLLDARNDGLVAVRASKERSQDSSNTSKLNIFEFSRTALGKILKDEFGLPAFRSTQIFQWLYRKGVTDFEQMTDLGAELREKLTAKFEFRAAEIHTRQISSDGTRKYVFKLADGKLVESVMIKQPTRMTLCVSSQVGCGMGCKFCQTATMGFVRHLTPGEIMAQVMGVIEDAKQFGDGFSNMVFMGMGEPLHNYKGVLETLQILTDHHGLSISQRRITVSTSGLVPAIKAFATDKAPANLAISLNATTDDVRSRVMPINQRFPISELMAAAKQYAELSGKEVTLEYVMLSGLNDTAADLSRLVKLVNGLPSKINLIPYNDNAGLGFDTPAKAWVMEWRNKLVSKGINATVRWSKGQDINAACGQLVTESIRNRATSKKAGSS